jgi:sigma-B regulation protein RsbU (phosphoserine phosphatase)
VRALNRDGNLFELDADGLIIGVIEDVEFAEHEIELFSGDVILFYTDGLVEATNKQGELFGTKRIFNSLKRFKNQPVNDIIESLYSEIRTFTVQETLQDDISIIVVKVL